MKFFDEELKKRALPPLFLRDDGTNVTDPAGWEVRRKEIKDLLYREFYGYPCRFPTKTEGIVMKQDPNAYGGKAYTDQVELRVTSPFAWFSFPCTVTLPKGADGEKHPVFVYLSFQPQTADGLGEEIIDSGYGIVNLYYQDIAADREDGFVSGVGRFCSRNPYDSWGKLAMWAWGAQRAVDCLLTRTDIDPARIGVMGHSRLGKAALAAGMFDERFSITVSNDSGAGGAALFRQKKGEKIADMKNPGANCWFGRNLFAYADKEDQLPFDMHFLLALAAPRFLYVCSASEDDWADPESEYLSCLAASPAYELYGLPGLIAPDRYPQAGDSFPEGRIGYHMRKGTHYLSRYDWQKVIAFRDRNRV